MNNTDCLVIVAPYVSWWHISGSKSTFCPQSWCPSVQIWVTLTLLMAERLESERLQKLQLLRQVLIVCSGRCLSKVVQGKGKVVIRRKGRGQPRLIEAHREWKPARQTSYCSCGLIHGGLTSQLTNLKDLLLQRPNLQRASVVLDGSGMFWTSTVHKRSQTSRMSNHRGLWPMLHPATRGCFIGLVCLHITRNLTWFCFALSIHTQIKT